MLSKDKKIRLITAVFGLAVLGAMGYVWYRDSQKLLVRVEDTPPVIDFTWAPTEPMDLRDLRGFLTMKDDYALVFKTYKMRIVELIKEWDLPIDGMIGKDYEQPISLGLIADKPEIQYARKVTVQFSISDDKGQRTTIERIIKLK